MPTQNRNLELVHSIRSFYFKIGEIKTFLENKFLPATKEEANKLNLLRKRILTEVEKKYKIQFSDIIYSKSTSSVEAKAILILLFNKHLALTQREIADLFMVSQQHISERVRNFRKIQNKKASSKHIFPNKMYLNNGFMGNFQSIDKIIAQYKLSLWK